MGDNINSLFFIGSKDRLFFPMRKKISNANLFIEPDEYENYYLLYGNQFNIIKLEKNNGGFGFLLNSMLKFAIINNYKKYIFCDDDILSFSFRNKRSNLYFEISKMIKIMEKNNYSQLMMSFKGHNWYEKKLIKEKIGAWCFVLNNTKDLKNVGGYDEKLPIYNDWDMSAKLICNGYKTACYYGAMFDHKMKSNEGGAAEIYKRQASLNEAENILRNRYGDHCITNKNIHNQIEIRFNWNKL